MSPRQRLTSNYCLIQAVVKFSIIFYAASIFLMVTYIRTYEEETRSLVKHDHQELQKVDSLLKKHEPEYEKDVHQELRKVETLLNKPEAEHEKPKNLFSPRRYHGEKRNPNMEDFGTTTLPAFVKKQFEIFSNEAEVVKTDANLADRLLFYNASTTDFSSCSIEPQNWTFPLVKTVYHIFQVPFEYKNTRGHFIRFYFDDRFVVDTGRRYVRTTVAFEGPEVFTSDLEKKEIFGRWRQQLYYEFVFYAYFWYKGFVEEVVSSKCFVSASGGLVRNLNDNFYHQKVVSCPVPEIHLLPNRISLSINKCGEIENRGLIYYPKGPKENSEAAIGLCMSSMYGTIDDRFTPYFVNWIELLQLLGVSHVTTNNASLHLNGTFIQSAFSYYQKIGYLEINQYPVIEDHYPDWQSKEASNSISKMSTSDCYMRYMHRYWYTLIHDMDEIAVPTKFKTIAEYLQTVLLSNKTLASATCLSIRSAYHFSFLNEKNTKERSRYPDYLPILRQSERWPMEEIGKQDKVGMSKSINNNRQLSASGNHCCWPVLDPMYQKEADFSTAYLPAEDILIHHFRQSCNLDERCKDNPETVYDPVIADNWGADLELRVHQVLKEIHWPDL